MQSKQKLIILSAILSITTFSLPASAFNLGSLFGSSDKEDQANEILKNASNGSLNLDSLQSQLSTTLAKNALTSSLSNDLGIDSIQAAGGAGAMLAMAAQSLNQNEASELNKIVPQLSSLTSLIPSNVSSNLTTMSSVNNVFESLGLSTSMIQQFSPIILSYLTSQGASGTLNNALQSLWLSH